MFPKKGETCFTNLARDLLTRSPVNFCFPFYTSKVCKKKKNFASAGCWGPYNPDFFLGIASTIDAAAVYFISWEDMKDELFDYYTPFSTKKKRETCNIKYRRKEVDRQAGSRAGIRRVIGFPACWTRHPSLTQSLCSSALLFFVCVSLSLASLHVYMCCPSIARGSDSGSLIPAEEMTAGGCRKKDTEWKGL